MESLITVSVSLKRFSRIKNIHAIDKDDGEHDDVSNDNDDGDDEGC